MSSPDQRDFQMLIEAFRRNGVISGCAVTEHAGTPAMSVDVAVGLTTDAAGTTRNIIAAVTKTITAADGSNPRIDLIYTTGTTVNVATGTAAANPIYPPLPDAAVCLAAVFVDSGVGSIVNAAIIDKRVSLFMPNDRGWVPENLTRTGNHTFTVARDTTGATGDGTIDKGTKLRYTDSGTEYGVVASVSVSAGVTTLTLITNTSYVASSGATGGHYSNHAEPPGWPTWFGYTPGTTTGFSSNPATFLQARFRILGMTTIEVIAQVTSAASSGSVNTTTFVAPVAAVSMAGSPNSYGFAPYIVNNSAQQTALGMTIIVQSGTTTVNVYRDTAATAWSLTGNRGFVAYVTYQF